MINISKIIKESYQQYVLLTEGGASGHMLHLFEDPSLTLAQLKDIFTKLFSGKISISEKTDGQALAITYKDGEVKASRNKATLKNPMSIKELNSMFEGRGELSDAFVKSMTDISNAINVLPENEKQEIFNNGHNFMAFEIIYPPTKNVVYYGDKCLIQLHGVNIYDDKWNKVSEDKELATKLYNYLKKAGVLNQKTFEITHDSKLKIKDAVGSQESLAIVLNKLDAIAKKYGYDITIDDYTQFEFAKRAFQLITDAGFKTVKTSKFVKTVASHLSKISASPAKKIDIKNAAIAEGINIKSQQFKDFMTQLDNVKPPVNREVIQPLEDVVITAGLLLMKNLVGYVSMNKDESAQKLVADLDKQIDELSQKTDSLTPSELETFKNNLAKLERFGKELTGVEGIVFLYKGKVYKMTATFGALNQLLGILKFKR